MSRDRIQILCELRLGEERFFQPILPQPCGIELLELVFGFCYLRSINEEPSLSTLSPYYLAEVDPLWKDILLGFPGYCTRAQCRSNTCLRTFLVWPSYGFPGPIPTMQPRRRASTISWTSCSPICLVLGDTLIDVSIQELVLPSITNNVKHVPFSVTSTTMPPPNMKSKCPATYS